VSTETHIGEYLARKLKETGRTKTWLAKQMNFSRQNLENYIAKDEFRPSELARIMEAIGDPSFFDEYEGPTKPPKPIEVKEDKTPSVMEAMPKYYKMKGVGYSITI